MIKFLKHLYKKNNFFRPIKETFLFKFISEFFKFYIFIKQKLPKRSFKEKVLFFISAFFIFIHNISNFYISLNFVVLIIILWFLYVIIQLMSINLKFEKKLRFVLPENSNIDSHKLKFQFLHIFIYIFFIEILFFFFIIFFGPSFFLYFIKILFIL
jgi:hypothetical protein